MAQANIERDRLYDREEARVEEREPQLHGRLVDVLVVGGDVSPRFVEQEEEIAPPAGILHVELGELLADAEHRHGEELAQFDVEDPGWGFYLFLLFNEQR